jgi:hypothetical protein
VVRQRTRNLLGIDESVADDKLRSQAKKALEAALNSENEQVRLRAALSLYSYRAAPPPDERPQDEQHSARRVYGIADLVAGAADCKIFSQLGGLDEETEQQLVRRLKAQRIGAETWFGGEAA